MTTVADVVAKVRDGGRDDFAREAVALVARELMDARFPRRSAPSSGR